MTYITRNITGTEKLINNKHVVEWDEFNDIEKANLRFLISIEEEYGYR